MNQPAELAPMHIVLSQPEPPDEFYQWLTDIHRVKDAGPELLRVLRKICSAETKPDLMKAITEGVTLCEKMPVI